MKLSVFFFLTFRCLASSLVHFSRRSSVRTYTKLYDTSNDQKALSDLKLKLDESDFPAAYQILKRNPMMNLSMEEGRILLNNLDKFLTDKEEEERIRSMISECAPLVYRRLSRQNAIRGFSSADETYPEESPDISPARLEEITGLSISALTPKQRQTYWRLITFGVISFEFILGSSVGIDPLYTFIPATFFLFGVDQLAYKGAFFDTLYRLFFRNYEKKIIAHEAGHFLISYLLGLSVADCVTNAWDARKYSEIKGQAGTVFLDPRLMDEMAKQMVTRSSLDRLSVVLMGGIAAEAMMFGNAEGGIADEQSLFNLLANVQPPWNILRVQGQARWAVVQAFLLLKEHAKSFQALISALENKAKVGDCIIAIEQNLPTVLPSSIRLAELELKKKNSQRLSLAGYVSRLTRKVGGVLPISHELNISNIEPTLDGYISRLGADSGLGPTESKAGRGDEFASVQQGGDLMSKVQDLGKALAEALDAQEDAVEKPSQDGGVWLNGLQSYKKSAPLGTTMTETSSTSTSSTPAVSAEIPGGEISGNVIPPPVPGYEKRIREMEAKMEADRMILRIDEVRNLTSVALCSVVNSDRSMANYFAITDAFRACQDLKAEILALAKGWSEQSDMLDLAISVEETWKRVQAALAAALESLQRGLGLDEREQLELAKLYQAVYVDRSSEGILGVLVRSSYVPYPSPLVQTDQKFPPTELLATHRGFQMRRLENIELYYTRKTREIEARVKTLNADSRVGEDRRG